MDRILSDKLCVARKTYRCDASDQWRRSGYSTSDCETKDQALLVEAAEADKWKILPGQVYRKVVGIYEGDFCVYRARPGMDSVAYELDMWDCW